MYTEFTSPIITNINDENGSKTCGIKKDWIQDLQPSIDSQFQIMEEIEREAKD